MSRYRLNPAPAQEAVLRDHCGHARYIWNLAVEQHSHWHPGRGVRAKAGLNRGILASGWGLLVRRLQDKAPGRVEKISPAFTSQRCSACGQVDRGSRESQAVFRCTACGFAANADVNAAINIAACQLGSLTPARFPGPYDWDVSRDSHFRNRRTTCPGARPRWELAALIIVRHSAAAAQRGSRWAGLVRCFGTG
jgi:predicted RNA-binding Zn-ribbon protein involved in translation (DUF1610 family)